MIPARCKGNQPVINTLMTLKLLIYWCYKVTSMPRLAILQLKVYFKFFDCLSSPFKRQPHKMFQHTQTIRIVYENISIFFNTFICSTFQFCIEGNIQNCKAYFPRILCIFAVRTFMWIKSVISKETISPT